MKGLARLGALWNSIQSWLFPALEDELGELDEKHRLFVAVCETCAPGARMGAYGWLGNGCPPKSRLALFKAFVAKALWDFPTTRALLDAVRSRPVLRRLCGWETLAEVPSEATFSRAFAAFAEDGLAQSVHKAMLLDRYADKVAGHVSRDASAVEAREKSAKKKPEKAGGADAGGPEPTRLQRQLERDLAENLEDLPQECDWGKKKDSKGKTVQWRGYKVHADVIDGDIPVSWVVTSASAHDSQAAIPLAQMTAGRVASLYDLADPAGAGTPRRSARCPPGSGTWRS